MKKYLYVIPTILTTMYLVFVGICCLNNFNINIKSFVIISVIFVIPALLHIEQMLTDIFDCVKNNRIKWLPLLLIFSMFAVPYYTYKYILNKIILKNSLITYFISIVFLCALMGLYTITLVGKNTELVITTSDNKVEFKLDSNWKKINEPGYSVYAENSKKGIAFGVETFDLKAFEGYTADSLLEDRKNYINNKFESIEVFKDLKEEKNDDKTIKSISYKVKASESDEQSIYILSVISFDKDTDYLLYIFEQVSTDKYTKYEEELNDILKEAKLK